jgi:ATP-dependent Zn protease
MNSSARIKIALLSAALIVAAAVLWTVAGSRPGPTNITYTQFLQRVQAGQVAEVKIVAGDSGSSPATARLKDGRTVRTVLPSHYSPALAILEERLVDVEIQSASSQPLGILANATPFLLLLGLWVFLMTKRDWMLRWPR